MSPWWPAEASLGLGEVGCPGWILGAGLVEGLQRASCTTHLGEQRNLFPQCWIYPSQCVQHLPDPGITLPKAPGPMRWTQLWVQRVVGWREVGQGGGISQKGLRAGLALEMGLSPALHSCKHSCWWNTDCKRLGLGFICFLPNPFLCSHPGEL